MTMTRTTIALWIGMGMTAAAGCADDGPRGNGPGAGDPPLGTTADEIGIIPAWLVAYTPHDGLTATDVQGAVDQTAAKVQAVAAATSALAPVARSGAYADLTGTPELSGFARTSDLATVARTGAYADLGGAPALAPVATSGAYADLSGAPDLSGFATSAALAAYTPTADLPAVARTGAYADLTGTPDLGSFATAAQLAGYVTLGQLGSYATTASLARVATTGSYADLADKPVLSAVASSGSYDDLAGRPALSAVATSGQYDDLAGKPALSAVATSGSYDDLAGKPALAAVATSGSYDDLAGAPDLTDLVTTDTLPWQDTGAYAYAAIAGDEQTIADASLSGGSNCGATSTQIYQSFTALGSGPMKSAMLRLVVPVNGVTVQIRQGNGGGGALLYQSTVDLGPQSAPVPVSGVDLVAGQLYTIVYSSPSASWTFTCSAADPYAGGNAGTTGAVPSVDIAFSVFLAAGHPVAITPGGQLGVGTTAPTAPIDVAGNAIRVREASSPASNAACAKGELRWDASFVYVCVAQNQWRRAALASY
ncbi:MAG TPA: hypothetical protein VHE35_05040 [Kofleriaceae bacterium]|nr:hypothetical protein [Kofleriaceae bacterium]